MRIWAEILSASIVSFWKDEEGGDLEILRGKTTRKLSNPILLESQLVLANVASFWHCPIQKQAIFQKHRLLECAVRPTTKSKCGFRGNVHVLRAHIWQLVLDQFKKGVVVAIDAYWKPPYLIWVQKKVLFRIRNFNPVLSSQPLATFPFCFGRNVIPSMLPFMGTLHVNTMKQKLIGLQQDKPTKRESKAAAAQNIIDAGTYKTSSVHCAPNKNPFWHIHK